MSLFNEILNKIQEKLQVSQIDCEKIAKILSEELKITISSEDITVNNKTITVSVPQLLRQEILLRKNQLIEILKKEHIALFEIYTKIK